MIYLIAWLTICFTWLLYETDYMRVRLLVGDGNRSVNKTHALKFEPILCRGCFGFKCNHNGRWFGYKIPARTVKLFNSTITFAQGCNYHRSQIIKDIYKEQRRKAVSFKPVQVPSFVEGVRVGPHREWVETTPKHGFHRIVEEYTTEFHDCLPGKDWLKAHYQDTLPEPMIEVSCNGSLILSTNGDYKRGMIKELVKQHK